MQPLFEASGWSLPKNIAKETKKTKKQISQDQSKVGRSTQEADQLQAQLSSLVTPKKNDKKRSLEQDDKPSSKKSKQKKSNESKEVNKSEPEKSKKQENKKKEGKKPEVNKKNENKQSKKQKLQELLAKKNENKTNQQTSEKPSKQILQKAPSKKTPQQTITKPVITNKKDDMDAGLTPLQRKMKEKLSGARFRWLNEQLYTTPGNKSFKLFQEKPELFDEYHEGFRHQVESWPVNPVDVIVDQLKQLPKSTVIADLGCGDAMIAQTLTSHNVLSFDLIAKNELVTACDISKLPLEANSVDVAVFSLSLMGTNYVDFLKEAHRVLKVGGELKIAEVVSRFSDVDTFVSLLEELGFDFMDKEDDNKMFVMMYFTKQPNYEEEVDDEMLSGLSKTQKRSLKKGAGINTSKNKLQKRSQQLLKPCLYKKR